MDMLHSTICVCKSASLGCSEAVLVDQRALCVGCDDVFCW